MKRLLNRHLSFNDGIINAIMETLSYKRSLHTYSQIVYFHKTNLFEYINNNDLQQISSKYAHDNPRKLAKYPDDTDIFYYHKLLITISHKMITGVWVLSTLRQ